MQFKQDKYHRSEASYNLLSSYHVPMNRDFHTLSIEQVENIVNAANDHGYRKPKNAPGSRARMFYQYARKGRGKK